LKQTVNAAALISQADCISRAIRAEQKWSLLPEFGLIGSVFVPPKPEPGIGAPYPEFPVWLGKYSHSRKISRITQELQCIVSTTTSVTSRNILLSNYAHVMYVSFVKELKQVGQGGDPSLPILDALGVHKNDLLDLLTELLLPWQKNLYEDIDSKTKATITRICNSHHMMIKSGAAHFRTAKSVSSGAAGGLSLSDERGDSNPKLEDEEDEEDNGQVSRKKKQKSDDLVKEAKIKATAKPKSARTKK
jgi:replication factor C subunit 1